MNYIFASTGEKLYKIHIVSLSFPYDMTAEEVGSYGHSGIYYIARDSGGQLYGMSGAAYGSLYSIDSGTGAATLIGTDTHNSLSCYGLAFDTSDDTLYLINHNAPNDLWRVNTTTAQQTKVGSLGVSALYGLAYNPSDAGYLYLSYLYGTNVNRVQRLKLSDRTRIDYSAISNYAVFHGLVWNDDGIFYGTGEHLDLSVPYRILSALAPVSLEDLGIDFYGSCPGAYSEATESRVGFSIDPKGRLNRATVVSGSINTWRSLDQSTWDGPWVVAAGDVPSLVALPAGGLLCSYGSGGNCLVRLSKDAGATWGAAYGTQAGENPFMWIDEKGTLHRVYYSSSKVYHQISLDEGTTWTAATQVDTTSGEVYPMGCSLREGNPIVTWRESGAWEQHRNPRIDGGGVWS